MKKKRLKRLTLVAGALLMLCLFHPAAAARDVVKSQAAALDTDSVGEALGGDARDLMDGIGVMDSLDFDKGFLKLLSGADELLGGIVKHGVRSAALLLVISILCAVASSVYESAASGSVPSYIPLMGALAVSAVAVGDAASFIGLGGETMEQMDTFSKALLPTLAAAATASGQLTSAAAKYAVTALFTDVMLTLSDRVFMPLVYCYVAACVANAAVGGSGLASAAGLIKWLCRTILIVMILAFVAYITISGVISGTADVVSTRVAKTVLSTTLPVIGSIISDAASTVVAGASVLRNAIGVFGMLGVTAICLTPFLKLGTHYILYKLAAGMSSAVSDSGMGKLIGNIGDAFGMVIGMTGACAVMLYFSVISMIKAVGV